MERPESGGWGPKQYDRSGRCRLGDRGRGGLSLVETGTDSWTRSVEVLEISRINDLADIANLGLTLPETKQLLARVQQAVVAAQTPDHAGPRSDCSACGGGCHAGAFVRLRRCSAATADSPRRLWPHRDGCQLAIAYPHRS
jgi:hypothetical protein